MAGFWELKPLEEMTADEWESLCDGCGKCCLHKLEDEDTDELFYTQVACKLLDLNTCRCSDYPNRIKYVPDCIKLDINKLETFKWLPPSCSYRLIREGKPLPEWHYLITGDRNSIHQADASVKRWAVSEEKVANEDEWFELVIESGLDHP